ncbi:hypothetical protein ACDY96_34270 [Rhizobium mongolense]|uniref:hypothetical protein n=1 Tax=Rhizobium TaxID=379 RepID=UPI0024B1F79B|nr:hypothetical protein [Rhizobium sp. CC1099]WFU90217.1 hypothetical protein QA644_29935 [Rhizobium sp. CC1099]
MRKLDAREYKLLLNPAKFGTLLTKAHANAFWDGEIAPIVGRSWGGSLCVLNTFDELLERILRFWDTRDCALTAAEFILRSRVDAADGIADSSQQEIALKLRMADFFVVANAHLPASDGATTKFEEDIAPLEVKPQKPASSVVFPAKPSIRSRYSLTTKLERRWDESNRTEARLGKLFPTLEGMLSRPLVGDEALVGGPVIHELAAKGPQVRIAKNILGEFTLTCWYFETAAGPPAVAEMSFKCDTIDGELPGKAARRALELFNALQTGLGDYVNTDHSSKTAMGLPKGCARIA